MNQRPKTWKTLKKSTEKTLADISIGNAFLNRTPIAQEIRIRIDKGDRIKIKSFCTAKETITRVKRKSARYSTDKGLISRIYKYLKI
jgi:RNA-binding protein YhbY